MPEVDVVVVNELRGEGDERDVTREAAVVEPIVEKRGNIVLVARRIDGDDDEVGTAVSGCGDLAIERRKAALVLADALAVDPHDRAIVGGADVQEGALTGLRAELEVTLIPDHTFKAEERGVLRVPVTRDPERGRCAEVVLGVVRTAIDVGVRVLGVPGVANIAVFVVELSCGRLVDQVMPLTVQRRDLTMVNANQ